MKLIHCADIRLNASPEMSFGQEKGEERNSEILLTFVRMVRYAARNRVNAVLITGNLFIPGDISTNVLHIVKDCITGNPGIDFLYISGRRGRDEFTEAMRPFPQNFKVLGESQESVRYEDKVVISTARRPDELDLSESDLNIVMHYGTINPQDWEDLHIDYLASGGVAALDEGALGNRGRYCYSGTLEGRSFFETGQKGFIRLDISNNTIEPVFIQAAKRMLFTIDLETESSDAQVIKEEINDKLEETEISDSDLVEVRLKGCGISKEALYDIRETFAERFYFFRLDADISAKVEETAAETVEMPESEPETEPKPEIRTYSKTFPVVREDTYGQLREAFIKVVNDSDETEEDKEEILRIGLDALGGESV